MYYILIYNKRKGDIEYTFCCRCIPLYHLYILCAFISNWYIYIHERTTYKG